MVSAALREMIERIGRYQVRGELGRGGFGEVFRAYDPILDGFVAIKRLTAANEPDLVRRFRNEAAAARKLRHRNIVVVHDFGEQDGSPYLVMELLDGEDLEHVIGNRRPLPLLERLDVMMQVASGLHHANSHGIVHRDVKPANIMLLPDGTVKIMDFGIALLTQASAARETPKGAIIGTFSYMAPEHFRLGASSDTLTDIFAYGVTCYRLLTGVHPFQALEMGELVHNITNKTPAPIRALRPECPEALEEAVSKMLAKDRELRYKSFEDLHYDLEPIVIDLRKVRVSELLGEARRLMPGGGLEAALSLVRRVLEIEPGNRAARDLREGLQRRIADLELRPRVDALVSAGHEQLQARHFDAAIQSFESALRLDKSNPNLQALIDQARAAWENAQRGERLADQGSRLLESGELTAARESILEALSADPNNAAYDNLKVRIEARIRTRQSEHRLKNMLNEAKGLILLHSFDKAIESLRAVGTEYPGSTAVGELLDRAMAEQDAQARQQRLQAGAGNAKALLRNQQFEEALARLAQLRVEFPEDAELRDLSTFAAEELRGQKQDRAIADVRAKAQSLMESNRFDAALESLRDAVADFPGAAPLRDLLQTVAAAKAHFERTLALQAVTALAGALMDQQRFENALQTIAEFRRVQGDSAALEPLRRQAEQGYEEQRRAAAARNLVIKAKALLDEGRTDSATQILQEATIQFPGDAEVWRLLGLARDQTEAKLKGEAISKVVAEAESSARKRQFDQAMDLLDNGLKEHPGVERLLRCREATLATKALYEYERARGIALRRVRDLREQGKLEGAVDALEAALQKLGDDVALLDLKHQIEAEQRDRRRAEEIKSAIDKAQKLIDEGRFESATEILKPTSIRYPTEEVVTKLMLLAEAGVREQRHRDEIAKILQDARTLLESHRPEDAIGVLRSAAARFPEEQQVGGLLRTAEEALRVRVEEQDRVLRATVEDLIEQRRYEEAIALIATARDVAPLQSLLTQTNDLLDQKRRDEQRLIAMRQQREARNHDCDQLLAIEQLIPTTRKSRLNRLALQAQKIADRHTMDNEIAVIASSIGERIDNIRNAPKSPSRAVPWRWIMSGLSVALISAAIIFAVPLVVHWVETAFGGKPVATKAIEIRTDPQGATVVVGGQTCLSPNCRFEMKPGIYRLEARLKGFQPVEQTLIVDPIKPPSRLDLILEPVVAAAPPIPAGVAPAATGTLLVRAGIAGVMVFLDSSPRGRTDARGEFQTSLEVATYEVRVEKTGYQALPVQRVKIGAGSSQRASFTLAPELGRLEVRGAPAGVELRAGGILLGRTDGSALFSALVQPGDQVLQVRQGAASRRITRRMDPTGALRLAWDEIAPQAPLPPPANSEALEAQAWDGIRNSEDQAQLQTFIDRYPAGVRAGEARSRLDDLTWTYAKAHGLIELRSYLTRFPQGRHTREALDDVNRLKRTQEAEEDMQAVIQTLAKLGHAIEEKDETTLKAIWPSIPASTLEGWKTAFRDAKSIQYQLRSKNSPGIEGDRVMMTCELSEGKVFDSTPPYKTERSVHVSLRRVGKGWVVQSLR